MSADIHRNGSSPNVSSARDAVISSLSDYGVWYILLVVLAAACVTTPDFRDPDNLGNVLKQATVLGILAVGQTFVICAGLVDLSVGMLAGLIVVLVCALTDGSDAMLLPVGLVLLVSGTVLGATSGYLVERLKVHSVIFTFGMMSILQGFIFTYTDKTVGAASPILIWLANGQVLGIPVPGFVLAATCLVGHWLLARTPFGYHLKAAGGSPHSAERAGVNVRKIRIWAFALSGLTAAFAGLILAGRLGTGYPLAGTGLELDAVVAVVLGGTLLAGGRGSVVNSVGGVLTLTVISNFLNLLEVSSFIQMFLKGAIVVVAILLNRSKQAR